MTPGVSAADAPSDQVVARDAYSTTTKKGDAFRTRAFPEPVNFKAEDGSWAPIDRSFVREADGTLHPAAVDGDATIPSSISRPVVIEHDGRRLSFDLRGASGGRQLAGSKAKFDDALDGVDVAYKVRGNGLKETLTLSDPTSERTFTYDVTGDADLQATKSPDGQLVFGDEEGKERFRVAAPLAWDSAEPKAYANALELSVSKVSAGRWTVTLKADDAWLDDPTRVYPVTLDPDYYWVDLALRFHGASQDCYLASNDFANYSYCSGNIIQVGQYNRSFRGMFKFDVASAIPKYATATEATFLLWQPQSTPKGPANMRLRTVTRDWDNTSTWNQSKKNVQSWTTAGGDVSADPNLVGPPTTVGAQNYWYYWDAPLAAVNGWIKGTLPNYGLQLTTDPGSPSTTAYGFTSTDGDQALWPALDVTWTPDTTAPSGVVPAQTPAATDQTFLPGNHSSTITASAQDDASGIAKLELLRDADVVVSTANVACPNGLCPLNASAGLGINVSSWTEGAHTLKLRATDGAGNVTTTSAWNIYVDRTAPLAVNDIALDDYDPATHTAAIGWSDADDPAFADGSLGSDVNCEAKVGSGAWTAADGVVTATANLSDVLSVTVRCTDLAGNLGPEQLAAVTVVDTDNGDATWVDFAEGTSGTASKLAVSVWGDTGTTESGSDFMYGAPVSVKSAGGAITTRLTSDDGKAYFNLSAGTYQVWAPQTSDPVAKTPVSVVVAASGTTAHQINVDLSQPAFQSALRSVGDDAQEWFEQGINAVYCVSKIKAIACSDLKTTLDRTMAIEQILWGLAKKEDLRDTTRMNAFQHSFGTAWFIRIIQEKFGDNRKVYLDKQEPADAFDAIMHNEAAAQSSDNIDKRRASFQDRNNNRVGNGYQRTHRTRNAVQLCSAMRAKSFHARKISFTSGKDTVPNPPPEEQVRLIFRYKYAAADNPKPASAFPGSHPCAYAFSKVE